MHCTLHSWQVFTQTCPALSVSKKKSVNVEKYLDQEAEEALPEADEVSDEGHRETERSRPGLVR
jgi:hypothetical protein